MITPSIHPALSLFAAPGNAVLGTIFMYGALFAIFYFVLLRPQQKQRKTHDQLIRSLKKGDEVVTAGGIVGEVVHLPPPAAKDGATSLEDRLTIKSGETRLIIERGRITRVIRPNAPAAGTSTT